MALQTHLIGSRIPMSLYTQVEAYAGSKYTIGKVVRLALERLVSTASTKIPVNSQNTDNSKPSLDNPVRQKPSGRSDDISIVSRNLPTQ